MRSVPKLNQCPVSIDHIFLTLGCNWRLYLHNNYHGSSRLLRPGNYMYPHQTFRNDALSSLRPAGMGNKLMMNHSLPLSVLFIMGLPIPARALYNGVPLNQCNNHVFKLCMKRPLIQVLTCPM